MYNTDFCAWLQGYLALIADATWLAEFGDVWSPAVRRVIRAHINLTRESSSGHALTITHSWLDRELDTLDWSVLAGLVRKDFVRKPILSGFEAAYYLQGFFEVATAGRLPALLTLNRTQSSTICRELERNVDGLPPPLLDFYWQLREFQEKQDTPSELDTQDIQATLNRLFVHVIDDSYGFDDETRAKLQLAHDAHKAPDQPQ
jgi:hypothetical protein